MLHRAYAAQCAVQEARHTGAPAQHHRGLTLFALAFGTFAIGTGEFGSNGIIQLFASSLHISLPTATYAISAYACGVIVGSPLITLVAAHLNRRTLLLLLMVDFLVGNLLSAAASSIGMLIAARFITGMAQGAYFGCGAVVAAYVFGPGRGGKAFAVVMSGLTVAAIVGSPLATLLGQHLGWRATYVAVAGAGALATATLLAWVPRTGALHGGPVKQELRALRKVPLWTMLLVAALGISSIFAVYTFIGTFVTDAAGLSASVIPIALAVFGLGMAAGNLFGGRLADAHESLGLVAGFGTCLCFLAAIGLGGRQVWILMPALFGVGATMMMVIPTIQVRLSGFAPDAPTLVGALNLASLNVANVLGAEGGAATISAGWGTLSTVWAGFLFTSAGLVLYATAVPRTRHSPSSVVPAAAPGPSQSPDS
jgi:MFS transporter, DHA1 family, inner membrane transport protein